MKKEKQLLDVAKEWAEKTTDNSVFDWLDSRYLYPEEDVLKLENNSKLMAEIAKYADTFDYIVDCGYNGTYEDCEMRSYSDPEQGFRKTYW